MTWRWALERPLRITPKVGNGSGGSACPLSALMAVLKPARNGFAEDCSRQRSSILQPPVLLLRSWSVPFNPSHSPRSLRWLLPLPFPRLKIWGKCEHKVGSPKKWRWLARLQIQSSLQLFFLSRCGNAPDEVILFGLALSADGKCVQHVER